MNVLIEWGRRFGKTGRMRKAREVADLVEPAYGHDLATDAVYVALRLQETLDPDKAHEAFLRVLEAMKHETEVAEGRYNDLLDDIGGVSPG